MTVIRSLPRRREPALVTNTSILAQILAGVRLCVSDHVKLPPLCDI